MDERKTRFLKLRSRRFPNGIFGRQKIGRVTGAENRHNKLVITPPEKSWLQGGHSKVVITRQP